MERAKHSSGEAAQSPNTGSCQMLNPYFAPGVRTVRKLLSSKWSPDVLAVLADGSKHYTEIFESIRAQTIEGCQPEGQPVLHPKVLTDTLHYMERKGLINRIENSRTFPPSVSYRLTPLAYELIHAIEPATQWANTRRHLADTTPYPAETPSNGPRAEATSVSDGSGTSRAERVRVA
jgi:DNA-binding HxlR family transcriptional regulator